MEEAGRSVRLEKIALIFFPRTMTMSALEMGFIHDSLCHEYLVIHGWLRFDQNFLIGASERMEDFQLEALWAMVAIQPPFGAISDDLLGSSAHNPSTQPL